MSEKERPEIKTDCFAFVELYQPKCIALNALYCGFEHCSFYKPKEQEEKQKAEAERKYKYNTCDLL